MESFVQSQNCTIALLVKQLEDGQPPACKTGLPVAVGPSGDDVAALKETIATVERKLQVSQAQCRAAFYAIGKLSASLGTAVEESFEKRASKHVTKEYPIEVASTCLRGSMGEMSAELSSSLAEGMTNSVQNMLVKYSDFLNQKITERMERIKTQIR